MIDKIKNKIVDIKYEIDDSGGIGIFMTALLLTLLFVPFAIVYYLIIKPIYRTIRMIIDAPKLGIKTAYKKYYHSDQYKHEKWEKEREEKEALDSQLLPGSRQKKFEDWKDWPDAFVVDKIAIYAAGVCFSS